MPARKKWLHSGNSNRASTNSSPASLLKSEFLADISHELRSPLQTVIGFAELLAEENEGPLTEKQRRFLGHIQSDARHLLDLMNDLLDLSRIEAGRIDLTPETFDAGSAIEEMLPSIQSQASEKSITIQVDGSPSGMIVADRLRFKQVLYNLLTNAVKFTPQGGTVWVETVSRGDFLEISVRDSGIDIAKDRQAAIFDELYQVRGTTRQAGEGIGLGLAIAKRLVQHQGGRIWVDSEPGQGSRFAFTVLHG